MAFKIERNDITLVRSDAIVNTANPEPIIGEGTDSAIYTAAGADRLLEARQRIGKIPRGQVRHTPAFNLSQNGVRYIIHAVGITYKDGQQGEVDILRSCYRNSLQLALELGCTSVAIPFLATGNYCFPKDLALQVAMEEISSFLLENETEMDVVLVVYDQDSFLISGRLFRDIQSFIDQNYIEENQPTLLGYRLNNSEWNQQLEPQENNPSNIKSITKPDSLTTEKSTREIRIRQELSIEGFLQQEMEQLNFQNMLQKLIADRNLSNKEVYKRAHISRQFFSKIITNLDYVPKKDTVMALGLAIELSLQEYDEFLARAGYSFIPAQKRDMIIKYCVLHRIYNIIEVNCILYSQGLHLLG